MFSCSVKVVLDISHSIIEESEERVQMHMKGSASAGSDAARILGETAPSFGGSSMEPAIPGSASSSSAALETDLTEGKGKGKGKTKGKGKGSKKKEPVEHLASQTLSISIRMA